MARKSFEQGTCLIDAGVVPTRWLEVGRYPGLEDPGLCFWRHQHDDQIDKENNCRRHNGKHNPEPQRQNCSFSKRVLVTDVYVVAGRPGDELHFRVL